MNGSVHAHLLAFFFTIPSPFFRPTPLNPVLLSLSFLVHPSRLRLEPAPNQQKMPVSCRSSKEHPSEICLCSVCHLSSDLFPRRQDGKIVLPGLLTSKESPSLGAESAALTDAQELAQGSFGLSAPLEPNDLALVTTVPLQVMSPITADRAHRPRVRSNTRTNGSGTSFGRFTVAVVASDSPESSSGSSTPNYRAEAHTRSPNNRSRPRSRSQTYHTATTAVSNPYPMQVDASHTRPAGKAPPDSRAKASAQESTPSYSPPPAPSSGNSIPATPAFKFCPPFVASDRIAFPPSSDAAKEGVTMIPWSARRRKQKYRSGFDSVAGQGKSKTMFRYYGPDTVDSDPQKR